MNNKLFCAIAIAFAELFVTAELSQAQIFGRRSGCSTGHCYVPPVVHHVPVVHHEPALVKAPDLIQTFVFNNIAPPGDLSPRGTTIYGVSRALEYNSPSSALYLDNTRRALEVASEFTSAARGVDSEILAAASIDAQGRAVEAAFRALKPDVTARSTTTTIRLRNGFPVFEEEPQAVPRGAVGGFTCLKCHAADSGNAGALARYKLDGPLSLEQYAKGKAAIEAGTMPPKTALAPIEKDRLVLQLGKLVEE